MPQLGRKKAIVDTIRMFGQKISGAEAEVPKDVFEKVLNQWYYKNILVDTAGYMGMELIRRVVGCEGDGFAESSAHRSGRSRETAFESGDPSGVRPAGIRRSGGFRGNNLRYPLILFGGMGLKMLSIERREKIKEILLTKKNVTVAEMADLFPSARETIRRDFESLSNEGFLIKTYGGASLLFKRM